MGGNVILLGSNKKNRKPGRVSDIWLRETESNGNAKKSS